MKLYSIARWGELFENNRSRTVKDLDWVSIPNRHDGENYTKIITHKEGAVLFAAWNLLVQVASKCNPRGVLVKDSGQPHTSDSLSMKTRAPKDWFDKTLEFLEKQTDWLNVEYVSDSYHLPIRLPTAHCEEGKGREGKEGKGSNGEFPKEVEFWNSNCKGLPKVVAMSDERWRHLRSRRQDLFWVANFEQAVLRVMKSDFCLGKCKSERPWRADFDWMLQSNVVPKIMEGKYDNRTPIETSAKTRDPSVYLWGTTRYTIDHPPKRSDFPEGGGGESAFLSCSTAFEVWKRQRNGTAARQ